MKTGLTIGIVPLTDCAPIAAAAELGYYADEGLEVTVSREPSWAGVRDKLSFGLLDAAQMLAPMALAMELGLTGAGPEPIVTGLSLGYNGNAITISSALAEELATDRSGGLPDDRPLDASALRPAIDRRAADGLPPLTFGVVFPFSTHHYQVRHWLRSGGIDVDAEVSLRVVPPPQVTDQLAVGNLDGFCVGEPWNTVAVRRGVGRTVVAGAELWPEGPEKVLAVRGRFATERHVEHAALLRATLRGCAWCGNPANHADLAELIAQPSYVGVASADLRPALSGRLPVTPSVDRAVPAMYQPSGGGANVPAAQHAGFLLDQMRLAGQLDDDAAEEAASVARRVYRADLYGEAADAAGLATSTA